jgi:Tfp pilus assembly protein PilO
MSRRPPPQNYVEASWHLDKRVNVSVILALLAQIVMFIWWAAQTVEQMRQFKEELASVKGDIKEKVSKIDELAEVKVTIKYMAETLSRLDRSLEKIIDGQQVPQRRSSYSPSGDFTTTTTVKR